MPVVTVRVTEVPRDPGEKRPGWKVEATCPGCKAFAIANWYDNGFTRKGWRVASRDCLDLLKGNCRCKVPGGNRFLEKTIPEGVRLYAKDGAGKFCELDEIRGDLYSPVGLFESEVSPVYVVAEGQVNFLLARDFGLQLAKRHFNVKVAVETVGTPDWIDIPQVPFPDTFAEKKQKVAAKRAEKARFRAGKAGTPTQGIGRQLTLESLVDGV